MATVTDTPEMLEDETKAGNYFVSNYPPYSFWSEQNRADALAALERSPAPNTPLGVYVHIPFCQKKCDYCYYLSYIGQSSTVVDRYLDAVSAVH